MISEGSRDTKDWRNDAENDFNTYSQKKTINISNFYSIFWSNKHSFDEQKRLHRPQTFEG